MKRTTLKHRIILVLLLLTVLGLIIVEANRYWRGQQQLDAQLRQSVERQSLQAAQTLNQQIHLVEQAAEAFAATISRGTPSPDGYTSELKALIDSDQRFYGGTVAFEPFSFSADKRLYAPYFARQGERGELTYMQIEDAYDYTLEEQAWYYRAIREGSRWSEPYFDESVGNILMTTYSARFYRTDAAGKRVPWGVVTIDLSMDTIGDSISALDTGINSYVELVTDLGTYLYSPDKERVLNRENILEQDILSISDSELLKEKITRRDAEVFQMSSTGRGEQSPYYSVASVEGAGWNLITTYYDEAAKNNTTLRQAQMRLVLLGVLLGVLLLLLLAHARYNNTSLPWPLTIMIGLLFALGTCITWYEVASRGAGADQSGIIVTDDADRRNIERYYREQAAQYLLAPPLFASVGVYLESVKFVSANDLQVTGIYWQKIPLAQQSQINPGVNLLGVMDLKQEDPVVTSLPDYTLYRWVFQGQFHLALDNKHYPLVRDVLSLRFIPADRSDNIILLPDIASYRMMSPIAKPGLHEATFLTGWNIRRSYFDLTPWARNSTFGLSNSLERLDAPVLAYNIEVEKVFVDAFISTLTPLIIASMLIFTIFYITTTDEEQISFMRTGVSFELGICASIFFVVVMSHIGVRRSIVSEHIFYLEYFYFLMYLNLIMLCLYSVLQVRHDKLLHRLTFNIPPEKLFFPVNMALIYLFTIAVFYR